MKRLCTPSGLNRFPSPRVLFDPNGIATLAAVTVGAGGIGIATGLSVKGSCLPTTSSRARKTWSGTRLLAMNSRIKAPAKREVGPPLVIAIAA